MKFEFDPKKSEANRDRHGIDFSEAQALWDDRDIMQIPVKTSDEPRFLVVGKISGRHWSGLITCQGDGITILSMRRSKTEEVELYES